MPSIHVAWALIVGVTLALLLKPLGARLLAALYPLVMLVTVVVTGNHYLMDAIGSVAIVSFATIVCMLVRWRLASSERRGERERRETRPWREPEALQRSAA